MNSRKPKQNPEDMSEAQEERLQLIEAVPYRRVASALSPPRWQGELEVSVDFPTTRPPRAQLH